MPADDKTSKALGPTRPVIIVRARFTDSYFVHVQLCCEVHGGWLNEEEILTSPKSRINGGI